MPAPFRLNCLSIFDIPFGFAVTSLTALPPSHRLSQYELCRRALVEQSGYRPRHLLPSITTCLPPQHSHSESLFCPNLFFSPPGPPSSLNRDLTLVQQLLETGDVVERVGGLYLLLNVGALGVSELDAGHAARDVVSTSGGVGNGGTALAHELLGELGRLVGGAEKLLGLLAL